MHSSHLKVHSECKKAAACFHQITQEQMNVLDLKLTMIASFLVSFFSFSFSYFLLLSCFSFHLLGLAGVSRQEEGQKGVSRGDYFFGNGKHQVALPIQLTGNVLRFLANVLPVC